MIFELFALDILSVEFSYKLILQFFLKLLHHDKSCAYSSAW
uniref:Uncharacterized protein n=1 Tax=Arundo donax TaxID=35708 RepID=A0A0A9GVA0_ARUDO